MQLSLAPEMEKIINDCVKSGEYTNAEEVVTAALQRLIGVEPKLDFQPGELDKLLKEAEDSGEPIPYETVRAEFNAMRAKFLAERQ